MFGGMNGFAKNLNLGTNTLRVISWNCDQVTPIALMERLDQIAQFETNQLESSGSNDLTLKLKPACIFLLQEVNPLVFAAFSAPNPTKSSFWEFEFSENSSKITKF